MFEAVGVFVAGFTREFVLGVIDETALAKAE